MLYIVATPIGNLGDMSKRAIQTLRDSDIIIAEDVSDAKRLLSAYDIHKKIIKYNDKNKSLIIGRIIDILLNNNVSYITSAGTPCISDPGSDLVETARNKGVEIKVVPGPSALVSAISISGIRAREFTFISFLPRKKGKIKDVFDKHSEEKNVLVFFESPHRIITSIDILDKNGYKCDVFIAKEMTKIFENHFKGTPSFVLDKLKESKKNTKGEFVAIVDFTKEKTIRKKVNKYKKE